MEPLISIIVPVYKTEAYLERCVDSLLRQSHSNLQVLLVNDGSPDNAGDIVDAYAAKDPRVVALHKPNGGVSSARNLGLTYAKGDYFMFVDSDDWVAPRMAERLLQVQQLYEADIVECEYMSIFKDHIEPSSACTGAVQVGNTEQALAGILAWKQFRSLMWNKLFRRQLFDIVRFPEGRIYEDECATTDLFFAAKCIVSVDMACYYYDRTREDSITMAAFSPARFDAATALEERMYRVWRADMHEIEPRQNDAYFETVFRQVDAALQANYAGASLDTARERCLQNYEIIREQGRPLGQNYNDLCTALEQSLALYSAVRQGGGA